MSMENYCRSQNLLAVVFFKLCGPCRPPRTKKNSQNIAYKSILELKPHFRNPLMECKGCEKPYVHKLKPHFRVNK